MIVAHSYKGQTIAIFGLGRTGLSAAKSLTQGGARVWAWDDNEATRTAAVAAGVAVTDLTHADWNEIDGLLLSPGIPHDKPTAHWSAQKAKDAGVRIICDIEIFAQEVASRASDQRPKIIAITGTNGKSTTTSLIGHILEKAGKDAQVGGNIGRGILDLNPIHRGGYYVLELSSYQLERTHSLKADVAVLLNLSPDHLDRHGDMAGYETAKRRIFHNQTDADTIVIGVDDRHGKRICTELMAQNGRSIIPVSGLRSLGRGVCAIKSKLYCVMGRNVDEIADLTLARTLEGTHNWQNAAAAYAATKSVGVSNKDITEGLLSFPGLAHRMEDVGTVAGVRFINDSKGTNVDATRQALKAYDNIYWIAGGVAKEGGLEDLVADMDRVKRAYLIGDAADDFSKSLSREKISHKTSGTLKQAVLCATKDALKSRKSNPVILLSPACASFDQFKNFEVRGDAFRAYVDEIVNMFETAKRQSTEGQAA
ncbi:MAG: UDP-N-acetylmuramoyl-L-alanine--D-glutamate ligase [Maricaulaceae bacterium]